MQRKCWNCGSVDLPAEARVCSDEVCQRAEAKAKAGHFKIKQVVESHARAKAHRNKPEVRARIKANAKEYHRKKRNAALLERGRPVAPLDRGLTISSPMVDWLIEQVGPSPSMLILSDLAKNGLSTRRELMDRLRVVKDTLPIDMQPRISVGKDSLVFWCGHLIEAGLIASEGLNPVRYKLSNQGLWLMDTGSTKRYSFGSMSSAA